MAMTEKQGGSDVRANTTQAVDAGGGWAVDRARDTGAVAGSAEAQ